MTYSTNLMANLVAGDLAASYHFPVLLMPASIDSCASLSLSTGYLLAEKRSHFPGRPFNS